MHNRAIFLTPLLPLRLPVLTCMNERVSLPVISDQYDGFYPKKRFCCLDFRLDNTRTIVVSHLYLISCIICPLIECAAGRRFRTLTVIHLIGIRTFEQYGSTLFSHRGYCTSILRMGSGACNTLRWKLSIQQCRFLLRMNLRKIPMQVIYRSISCGFDFLSTLNSIKNTAIHILTLLN